MNCTCEHCTRERKAQLLSAIEVGKQMQARLQGLPPRQCGKTLAQKQLLADPLWERIAMYDERGRLLCSYPALQPYQRSWAEAIERTHECGDAEEAHRRAARGRSWAFFPRCVAVRLRILLQYVWRRMDTCPQAGRPLRASNYKLAVCKALAKDGTTCSRREGLVCHSKPYFWVG